MLILPATEVNFQAYADNIAGEFFGNGIPLSDGIVKVAKDNEFTPEEVKRLVEKTNTAASLHLLKTAKDRKATFTLANLEQVLQQVFPADTVPLAKVASVYTDIPETRCKKHEFSKTASDKTSDKQQLDNSIDGLAALSTINNELDTRRMEKLSQECVLQKKINGLCQHFIRRDPVQFQKFASACVALYGNKCQSVLDGIAKYLDVSLDKTASDTVIDDTPAEFGIMEDICSGLERLVKLGEEIGHLEKLSAGIWAGAKKMVWP